MEKIGELLRIYPCAGSSRPLAGSDVSKVTKSQRGQKTVEMRGFVNGLSRDGEM